MLRCSADGSSWLNQGFNLSDFVARQISGKRSWQTLCRWSNGLLCTDDSSHATKLTKFTVHRPQETTKSWIYVWFRDQYVGVKSSGLKTHREHSYFKTETKTFIQGIQWLLKFCVPITYKWLALRDNYSGNEEPGACDITWFRRLERCPRSVSVRHPGKWSWISMFR